MIALIGPAGPFELLLALALAAGAVAGGLWLAARIVGAGWRAGRRRRGPRVR